MSDPRKGEQRILKELVTIQKEPIVGCTAEPISMNNIREWRATLDGPPDSPYEGGVFHLRINFPDTYPFTPPRIWFTTKVYHCNISTEGAICLDILKASSWSPALTLVKVLLSISSLLTDPNPNDPLVASIAQQYKENRAKHDKTAREWTIKYAMVGGAKKAAKSGSKKGSKAAAAAAPSAASSSEVIRIDDGPSAPAARTASAAAPSAASRSSSNNADVIVLD